MTRWNPLTIRDEADRITWIARAHAATRSMPQKTIAAGVH